MRTIKVLPVNLNRSTSLNNKHSDISFGMKFSRTCEYLYKGYARELEPVKPTKYAELIDKFEILEGIDLGLHIDAFTSKYNPRIEISTNNGKSIILISKPKNFCHDLLRLLKNPEKLICSINDETKRAEWIKAKKPRNVNFWAT